MGRGTNKEAAEALLNAGNILNAIFRAIAWIMAIVCMVKYLNT